MIKEYFEFYYAVKTLKSHGLKLNFDNILDYEILTRPDEKHVCYLRSHDALIGYVTGLENCNE